MVVDLYPAVVYNKAAFTATVDFNTIVTPLPSTTALTATAEQMWIVNNN